MKFKTIKKYLYLYIVNHVLAGTTKFFECKRKLLCEIGYEIGENTKIVGPISGSGSLRIGKNCWIAENLVVRGIGTVTIGDNCDIAPDVTFLTGGHEIGGTDRRAGTLEVYDISVGDGTWVGARSSILKGITIGSGCVVAACSCVIRNVPNNTLVGGVPAKRIKELEDGATEHIQE